MHGSNAFRHSTFPQRARQFRSTGKVSRVNFLTTTNSFSTRLFKYRRGRRLKFKTGLLLSSISSRSIVVRNIQKRIEIAKENVQGTPHSRARDHRPATCTNGNLLPRNLDIPLLREHRFAGSRESETPIIKKKKKIRSREI